MEPVKVSQICFKCSLRYVACHQYSKVTTHAEKETNRLIDVIGYVPHPNRHDLR